VKQPFFFIVPQGVNAQVIHFCDLFDRILHLISIKTLDLELTIDFYLDVRERNKITKYSLMNSYVKRRHRGRSPIMPIRSLKWLEPVDDNSYQNVGRKEQLAGGRSAQKFDRL
jgi:hypothetical protein